MATRRVTGKEQSEVGSHRRRPATTPEARENQLISSAYDLAEKQIRDGTASSQVITHFLKLGSSRDRLEQERIAGEVELNRAKIEAMESHKKIEELYGKAIEAMRFYSGHEQVDGDAEEIEE